ncbi:MAG: nitrite/sulfite reductase [Acidobacteria bacterium]|nr:nitrite/sulfite reductase [Acidobacteriota bacterium]
MNIEEVKKRKDGLDVLADIYRYATLGDKSVSPEDEALFRWYGIYTQRPAEDGFFMVRLRIPGGTLTPNQLHTIADLSNKYARGSADITVRQNIQFHWVRIESLPEILNTLQSVGLSTTEACGDCVRNIISCPVSGVDQNELFDTSEIINNVNKFFLGNREFSNLPRKFKIAITGCHLHCIYPEINDIGIFAVGTKNNIAFRVRVGGGLSTMPRFSKDLGVLLDPDEIVEVCGAMAEVFRDEGNRTNRKRARLKFLIEQWEIPRFRQEVENRLGRKFIYSPQPENYVPQDRSHSFINNQHNPDLSYVPISVLGGRTSGDELKRLAELTEQCGSSRIRTTNTQSIILLDIPNQRLEFLKQKLDSKGFNYAPSWSRKSMIACTGTQFCKLAIAETKTRAAIINDYLEQNVELDTPLRISVTGCPNSCGQHHICDVGLEGALVHIGETKQEVFQVFLGGGVGKQESFGKRIGVRIKANKVGESLAQLFNHYKENRIQDETFQEFCLRHTSQQLKGFLGNSAISAISDNFVNKTNLAAD